MTGTGEVDQGEVDHEVTSEEELEKEREKERERERESEREKEREGEREGADEGEVAANFKPAHISEELAALGYYARSMKPRKGWLSERESFLILYLFIYRSPYFRYLRP